MEPQTIVPVTVYWRPGCPFCARLRRDLQVLGLPVREVNIWADPGAAARVRSLAGGNETVPTVLVGEHAMVNPSASEVVGQVRRDVPGFTPDEALARAGRAARLVRVIAWSVIGVLVVLGVGANAAGHAGLSWLADGAAVAVWLLSLLARRLLAGRGPGGLVSRTRMPEG